MKVAKLGRRVLACLAIVVLIPAGFYAYEFVGVADCPIFARLLPVRTLPAFDGDFIELETQGSLGVLPSYRIRIQGDGSVDWFGERCVAATGYRQARIDPLQAKALIEGAESGGFCRLCRNYLPEIDDLTVRRVAVSLHGERKDVIVQSLHPPPLFSKLSRSSERVGRVSVWIGNAPQPECDLNPEPNE